MDKILIIDDNGLELSILRDILKHKYEIIIAQDGQKGYELAFKKVNDTYGHMMGDSVLIQLANLLKQTIHEDDSHYIARYGGEEFVVILYNTTAKEGLKCAQQLCDDLKALNIPNENSKICPVLTLSIGGSTIVPTDSDQMESFIIQADQNLYQAKNNGRNQVVWFTTNFQ